MLAWKHALMEFSKGKLSLDEAHRTWRVIFQRAIRDFDIPRADPVQSKEYPLLPFERIAGDSGEWNPVETFNLPPVVKKRQPKPQTFLDCCVAKGSGSDVSLGRPFNEPQFKTQGFEPKGLNIWPSHQLLIKDLINPAYREGLVVSALLSIDTEIGSVQLLSEPFPKGPETRYPAIWLDSGFLEH
ncbi:hypothetical protein B0O99DRAFT_626151 [Bisporella sp. PMI_857]|nr:hypothetical protein B0O99DRAFT_626151 [Bisporella sp. PMI_857]